MRKNFTAVCLLLLAAAVTFISACGSSKPEGARIHGTVTLDGKPIPQATIVFRPTGVAKGRSVQFQVVDGRYEGKQEEGVFGNHRVEIYAQRPLGPARPKQDLPPGMQPGETSRQYLHESYNRRTTLKHDIQPGDNEANFPLTSRGT